MSPMLGAGWPSVNVGAIFIKENQELVGIWTERDLVRDSLSEGGDPKTAHESTIT